MIFTLITIIIGAIVHQSLLTAELLNSEIGSDIANDTSVKNAFRAQFLEYKTRSTLSPYRVEKHLETLHKMLAPLQSIPCLGHDTGTANVSQTAASVTVKIDQLKDSIERVSQYLMNENKPSVQSISPSQRVENYPLSNMVGISPIQEPSVAEGDKIVNSVNGCPVGKNSYEKNPFQEDCGTDINLSNEGSPLINRDLDTFYDNELKMKITDDNGILPESFHLETAPVGIDPVLVFKKPTVNGKNFLTKREAGESRPYDVFDYNNAAVDDEVMNDESYSEYHKAKHPKRLHKNVHSKNSKVQSKSISEENSNQTMSPWTKGSNSISKKSDDSINQEEISNTDSGLIRKQKSNSNPDSKVAVNKPGVKSTEVPLRKSEEMSENSNLLCKSVGKGPCQSLTEKCLPTGGQPKIRTLQLYPKKADCDYNKLMSGDLIDKYVKAVQDKATECSKISSELGICRTDFKDVRDQYNRIRSRNCKGGSCMQIVDELQCFLNWLLIVDEVRSKRSANGGIFDETAIGNLNSEGYPGCISLGKPSPQYQKLLEKVERYRENMNSWDFSSFELPESEGK